MGIWLGEEDLPVHRGDQVERKHSSCLQDKRAGLVLKCINQSPYCGGLNEEHISTGKYVNAIFPNLDISEVACGINTVLSRPSVVVTDRIFNLGSWVSRDGNLGQVQNLSVKTDLQFIGTTTMVINVPMERLEPVEIIPEGSIISFNSWIGRVTKSIRKVTVVVGSDEEEEPYVGVIDYRDCVDLFLSYFERKFPVFNTQKIKGPWHSLREATWELVRKGKQGIVETQFEGRVIKIEVEALDVNWFINSKDNDRPKPENRLESKFFNDITLINVPDNSVRIGSIRTFETIKEDVLIYRNHWLSQLDPDIKMFPDIENFIGRKASVQCVRTKTMVNVLWKDGSTSTLDAIELNPYQATTVDFIPGDFVTQTSGNSNFLFGIVQSALDKMNVVHVKWIDAKQQETNSRESPSDLQIYPGFNFFPGNIVFINRKDMVGFTSGLVVQCHKNGYILVKCQQTGDLKYFPLHEIVATVEDPRHTTKPFAVVQPQPQPQQFESKVETPIKVEPSRVETPKISIPKVTSFSWKESSIRHYFIDEPEPDPKECMTFSKEIAKQIKLMSASLADGTYFSFYDNRMDLGTLLLVGSKDTPFEDGIFLFDVYIPGNYPADSPKFYYKQTIVDLKLIPDVFTNKPFCVHELLGQKWITMKETDLNTIMKSLKEQIFVREPYFNTGQDWRKQLQGSSKGNVNSRRYNENLVTKLVDGMHQLITSSPRMKEWQPELKAALAEHVPRMTERISYWIFDGKKPPFSLQVVSPEFVQRMKCRLPALLALHRSKLHPKESKE